MVCFPHVGPGARPPLSSALRRWGCWWEGRRFPRRFQLGSSHATARGCLAHDSQAPDSFPNPPGLRQTACWSGLQADAAPAGPVSPYRLEASSCLKGCIMSSPESFLCLPRGEKLPATLAKSHPDFRRHLTTHLLVGICLGRGCGGGGEPQHFPHPSIPTLRTPQG